MVDEDSSVISIYYADLEPEAADELDELISAEYPDCEVEVHSWTTALLLYCLG